MLIEYGLKHIKLYHLYILYHIALSGILKKMSRIKPYSLPILADRLTIFEAH